MPILKKYIYSAIFYHLFLKYFIILLNLYIINLTFYLQITCKWYAT